MNNLLTPLEPPSNKLSIQLKNSERWFITGKTGSGKSFLLKALLRIAYNAGARIALVDGPDHSWVKDDSELARRGPGTVDHPRLVTKFNPKLRCQLFRPKTPGWEDLRLMAYLAAIFKEGNTTVAFDEILGVVDHAHKPLVVMQIWSQGRKHNIAAFAANQRPALVPELFMSQAENWAVYRLRNSDDRKKVADWLDTPEIEDETLEKYNWFYYNEDMQHAVLMGPIK